MRGSRKGPSSQATVAAVAAVTTSGRSKVNGVRERRLEDDAIRATLRKALRTVIFPSPYGLG